MSSEALVMAFVSLCGGGSGGGDGAAIDDVLGAVDAPGTVGYQECDEFGGFGGQGGSPDRDAPQGVHDPLQCRIPADTCAPGDAGDQPLRALGLNEPGGHRVDPHSFRPDLVGQSLAVGGKSS